MVKHWRRRMAGGAMEYSILPPHEPETFSSTTRAGAIGISFSGHRRAVRQYRFGPIIEADIEPGEAGVTPTADLEWLRVREPSECWEFHPTRETLAGVAEELGMSRDVSLPDVAGRQDAVIWSVACASRAALLGGDGMTPLEASARMRLLLRHILVTYGGAPVREARTGRLDPGRLARVIEYIEASPVRALRLENLAQVAALSPFHFLRMFRQTTGVTPHAFTVARRLQRARLLLLTTCWPVAEVARAAGYSNLAHFRRAFRRAFGVGPRELSRQQHGTQPGRGEVHGRQTRSIPPTRRDS